MKHKMKRPTTVELYKEQMKFAAGHFTIFSATEREHLHGHNFTLYLALDTLIEDNGLNFDYRYYKEKSLVLCKQLSHSFLLPEKSPYLRIEIKDPYYHVHFNGEVIPFLKKDVTLLPITNVTVEELSQWFLDQFLHDTEMLQKHEIQKITIKVFSSPGQSGSAVWEKSQ
jgi:6-pyruvoyltetrahydropterin/6-carboxytetrahydropterin synthase